MRKIQFIFLLILFIIPLSCSGGLDDMFDDLDRKVPLCVSSANGSDSNKGRGWKDALATIEKAMELAGSEDEIWVSGSFSGVSITKPVKLFGGFKGTEISKEERGISDKTSFTSQVTINSLDVLLDGFAMDNNTFANRAVSLYQGVSVVFNNCSFTGNNCTVFGSVMYLNTGTVEFTGCTFTGNKITSGSAGGVIYSPSFGSGSMKIKNCIFENNSTASASGGVIYWNSKGTLEISDTKFKNNKAGVAGAGGVIYCGTAESIIKINGCLFENNITTTGAGGALYFKGITRVEISGSEFINNRANGTGSGLAGGAIYCDSTPLKIIDCSFKGNSTEQAPGGAIYLISNTSAEISGSEFNNNKVNGAGLSGGAIYCETSPLKITDCSFNGNSTEAGWGGAIYITTAPGIEIKGSEFKSNIANGTNWGGAIFIYGGSTVWIKDSVFEENNAYNGGAIQNGVNSGSPNNNLEIDNCIFKKNSITNSVGGGINSFKSKLTVLNTVFEQNSSANLGGAISISGEHTSGSPDIIVNTLFNANSAGNFGGGVSITSSSDTPEVYILNSTFYGNTNGSTSGCVYVETNVTLHVYNSAFYSNAGAYSIYNNGTLNCFNNGWDNVANSGTFDLPQTVTSASFVSTTASDPDFMRLATGSSCIDNGTESITIPGFTMPLVDLAGNPRKAGNKIDIGAYEKQ